MERGKIIGSQTCFADVHLAVEYTPFLNTCCDVKVTYDKPGRKFYTGNTVKI